MADHINVESSALSACAARYVVAGVKLAQCTATYTQALGALSSDWTGKAFAIMSKGYDAIKELGGVKEQFEEAENALKGTFASMDTGTSPFA